MNINGNTKIIAFMGSTWKTSRMFAIYNSAFAALQLNYVYIPLRITDLGSAIEGIRATGIHACGITIPFKIRILGYLDGLDTSAQISGSANCLINNAGKLKGYNTDGEGALLALKKEGIDPNGLNVLIIGGGGAAVSLRAALNKAGASVRHAAREEFSSLPQLVRSADLLINATPIGMKGYPGSLPLYQKDLKKDLAVMDIVTDPRETGLLNTAKAAGCKTIDGRRMLLWQAVLKFKIFTGKDAPVKIMEANL